MKIQPIKIKTLKGWRLIGPGQLVFIVAEISGNHLHSYERAKKIIDAAARAGADAVKLQTYTPDTITLDSDKKYFQVKVNKAWKGQTLYSLYKKAYTPWEWQPKLKKYAEAKGLIFFSSPFDHTAVDFLEKMKVALYKIASFEVVDIPLLKRVAKTGKPVILSRGMASIKEIKLAISTLKKFGCPAVAVLHCVSSYPTAPEEMNLLVVKDIPKKFRTLTGLSDHSLNIAASIASVALGASIIEKHLTLARKDGGPDAGFSLEPDEFKELVREIRECEKSLGSTDYKLSGREKENVIFRKSLFAAQDIKKGERFTKKNIRSVRPGHGLLPKYYDSIINKKSARDIEKGTPLSWLLVKK